MRRLGELLLDRGVIAVAELHTALEACHRRGGRLGTHLLRFGFVDEQELLEALGAQHGVPFIPERVLLRSLAAVRGTVPSDVLQRLQAVPFDKIQGRLQVAMINPRDPAALEELSAVSSMTLEAFVATEPAIHHALRELNGEPVDDLGATRSDEELTATWSPDDWDELWVPPRVGPRELLGAASEPLEPVGPVMLATYPELTPVAGVGGDDHEVVDELTFRERLQEARHRDEVGDVLLRYAASYLSRLCLFALYKNTVVGWQAHGHSVVVDDVQSFGVPFDQPSLFRTVDDSGQSFVGPIPRGGINESLIRVLGEPAPTEVVVVPVRVKDRVVAFLLGDTPEESVLAVPLSELQAAATKAGIAFEVLILRGKIMA